MDAQRRALFICPSPFEIGTYFRALAIASALAKTFRYHVDLLCTGDEDIELRVDGVRVVANKTSGPNLTPLRGWNIRDLHRRLKFAARRRVPYDFIYSFEYQPNVSAIAGQVAKKDHAVHFNDWCDWYAGRHHKMRGIRFLQMIDHWMEEYPRKRADHVTVICESLRKRALESGVKSENLTLLREGANRDGTMIPTALARRSLGIEKDAFIIVAMADMGHAILKSAIERLKQIRPNARLVVLGNVNDLPRNHSHISLPGRVSNHELHQWLCAADVAWLAMEDTPVNRGRLPHKIGHFRLYGLPLITTPVGDVVDLGDPNIYFTSYDGESFSTATEKLRALNDESREKSIAQAELIFDWSRILAPLVARIEAAVIKKKSGLALKK